ncbi:MAG: FAD-dependent oxidoreductase [Ferrimicrobium sp.]
MTGRPTVDVDVCVVGAGPAGSAAAIAAAQLGARVVLVERATVPGAKNLFGGVVYPSILEQLLPGRTDQFPVERWITSRFGVLVDGDDAVWLGLRSPGLFGNAATVLRSRFDAWLGAQAQDAGVTVVTGTRVGGVVQRQSRIRGVVLADSDEVIRAEVVVAADGVNSEVATWAGCAPRVRASEVTLGVKQVLALSASQIEERFGCDPDEGVEWNFLGGLSAGVGGGFLYTNRDSISIGLVVTPSSLIASQVRPETILQRLITHPSLSRYLRGSELIDYGAHLIPKYRRSRLAMPGLVVAGDAGGLCLSAGLWLEGVNYAIGSGMIAGHCAADAALKGLASEVVLTYPRAIASSSFGKNLRHYSWMGRAALSPLAQQGLPSVAVSLARGVVRVDDRYPKIRLTSLARGAIRGIRVGTGTHR